MPKTASMHTTSVQRALKYAKKAHAGQKRTSGEPYHTHLVAVADLLEELGADAETLIAALLHDAVEDTAVTYDDLRREFGTTVSKLVEGVTKMEHVEHLDKSERNLYAIRKLFRAMGKDIRVIFIKLADRMHNMQTLDHVPREKQLRIARETMDIYCPVADLLGMRMWFQQLSDLCFQYLYPSEYELVKRMEEKMSKQQLKKLRSWINDMEGFLREKEGKNAAAKLERRPKRSVYHRMADGGESLQRVETFYYVRVVVPNNHDCYSVLGAVHEFGSTVPGFVDDYISIPKINGYKAIHTRIVSSAGNVVDVIIQTEAMAEQSRYGLAMLYRNHAATATTGLPDWIETLTSLEKDEQDLHTFFNVIQREIFGESKRVEVCVKGSKKKEAVDVPVDSTILDVAYYTSDKNGNAVETALVNNHSATLNHIVADGDVVTLEFGRSAMERRPREAYILNTSMAQKCLMAALSSQPKHMQIRIGREWQHAAIDLTIDPFFNILWRKQLYERAEKDQAALAKIGTAALDPFRCLEEWSAPEEHFLLDPACFRNQTNLQSVRAMHFVLRATIDEFRSNHIIGLQVGPDVIDVISADILAQEKKYSKEFVPLTIDRDAVLHPFSFALRCTFAAEGNLLEGISMLQNLLDTPVKLLRFENDSVTLGFHTDRIGTVHIAYQHLSRLSYVRNIFRITPP